jgi:hypothetical protein
VVLTRGGGREYIVYATPEDDREKKGREWQNLSQGKEISCRWPMVFILPYNINGTINTECSLHFDCCHESEVIILFYHQVVYICRYALFLERIFRIPLPVTGSCYTNHDHCVMRKKITMEIPPWGLGEKNYQLDCQPFNIRLRSLIHYSWTKLQQRLLPPCISRILTMNCFF